MNFFFRNAHSGIRYLILLGGILTVLYAVYGAASGRTYDKTMKVLASSFVGFLYLQSLLGLAFLFSGRFQPAVAQHIFMMVFATAAAHIPVSVMRRRPEEEKSYLPHAVGTVAALAIIVAGLRAIGSPIVG